MGANGSLPQDQLNELLNSTKFKKHELKRWYAKFMRDYPHGQLNKEQFIEIFTKLTESGKAEELAVHIFRTFDTNNDNQISFQELMCSFSVTSRGSVREKLEWTFNIYDINNDGSVTVEEIRNIMKCMQHVADEQKRVSDDDVLKVFNVMDINADGRLTLDEFVKGVQMNPTFVNMLNGAYT